MLNKQITITPRGERRKSANEIKAAKGKIVCGKALTEYKNRLSKSYVCNGAVENDRASRSSSDTSDVSGTQSSLDKEKQENSKEPAKPVEDKVRGHFNSKFNNRLALSLHPPVSMETGKSNVFSKAEETPWNDQDSKRIIKILEKAHAERNQTHREKHLQREDNETIGEKTIKLAREKNTHPEVISKRRHETESRHFLPRINEKVWSAPPSSRSSLHFDKTFLSGHEDVEDPHARKTTVLAWSECVFPAILVEFPERKSVTSLARKQKRVKRNLNTKRDALRPAVYTELGCPVQQQPSAERPVSRLLYPSHHGH